MTAETQPDARPPATLWEQLLQPKTLQRMMAAGGGVLVLGFVSWLWSIGIFEHPVVAAAAIGATNLAVLGLGMSLVRWTRYQLAGQGLTLLGALALPLNLWFYDAQGLITITEGGHLWIPAAACCGIYAVIARVIRQPMFVYTFVGGIVMTGLLFLADAQVGHFWELMPPATLLVVTGCAAMLAERLFPENEGDFSRQRFGRAFYRAGSIVLGLGLAVLMAGQLTAIFAWPDLGITPRIAKEPTQKAWGLGLIFTALAVYAADFLADRKRHYSGIAVSLLGVWAFITTLDLCDIMPRLPHLAIGISLALVAINLMGRWPALQRRAGSVAAVLGELALLQFGLQFYLVNSNWCFSTTSWLVVAQLGTAALACATHFVRTRPSGRIEALAPLGGVLAAGTTISACLAATVASGAFLSIAGLVVSAVILAGAALPFRHREQLQAAASAALSAHLFFLVVYTGQVALSLQTWTWTLGLACAIYLGTSLGRPRSFGKQLAWLAGLGACFNLMQLAGVSQDVAIATAPTLAGLLLASSVYFRRNDQSEAISRMHHANLLVVVGGVITMLLSFSRVIDQSSTTGLLGLIGGQLAVSALFGIATRSPAWRWGFRAVSICLVITGAVVFNSVLQMHWLHRVEMGGLLVGMAILCMGHVAWYREAEQEEPATTFFLWLGSLLMIVPVAIGLIVYRSAPVSSELGWMLFHDVAAVIVGLSLFAVGVACHIRSTTISGAALLTTFVLSLIALIRWPDQLQNASIVMMIGGGIFFATAAALSIYRDRIAALPEKIREGHGVFRVLKWR